MKIIVLAGGNSPERNVSLSSGVQVANALKHKGYNVMLLDLAEGVKSDVFPPNYRSKTDEDWGEIPISEQAPEFQNELWIGEGIIPLCQDADVVFLALHGSIGENGMLQALLELNHINFTGTNYVGSLLAMDKPLAKRIMTSFEILTPEWLEIEETTKITPFDYPCILKPCSYGSSVGVVCISNEQELKTALQQSKKLNCKMMLERKIEGREFSLGILDNKPLPIIEIVPKDGFYDYKHKYTCDATEEIVPAKIPLHLQTQLEKTAIKVHKALRLGYYSRIDFIVDKQEKIYCLEANTLPGMTPMSLIPKEAASLGISFEDLCEKIALQPRKNQDI